MSKTHFYNIMLGMIFLTILILFLSPTTTKVVTVNGEVYTIPIDSLYTETCTDTNTIIIIKPPPAVDTVCHSEITLVGEKDNLGHNNIDSFEKIRIEHDIRITDWEIFKTAVYRMASGLNTEHEFDATDEQVYDWMMKVFYAESKFKYGPGKAINPYTDARGLIQWMPFKRKKLGIPEHVNEMKPINQLPFVYQYFQHIILYHSLNTKKIGSFIDFYMMVFMPAYADNPDTSRLFKSCQHKKYKCKYYAAKTNGWKTKGTKRCAYHANSGYDYTIKNGKRVRDGYIYKYEVREYILDKHYRN